MSLMSAALRLEKVVVRWLMCTFKLTMMNVRAVGDGVPLGVHARQ